MAEVQSPSVLSVAGVDEAWLNSYWLFAGSEGFQQNTTTTKYLPYSSIPWIQGLCGVLISLGNLDTISRIVKLPCLMLQLCEVGNLHVEAYMATNVIFFTVPCIYMSNIVSEYV